MLKHYSVGEAAWKASPRAAKIKNALRLAAAMLLVACLLGACSNEKSVFSKSAGRSDSEASGTSVPWDYRIVAGTVGDIVGSDMTVLPDNALLPNDGNYATGDKIWTLQYMSANMTEGEGGRSEVGLSAWTPIKSYPDEAKAKADIANLKISIQTNVELVGVYLTEYKGQQRRFAIITLPSGNRIKQPIDQERYAKLKGLKKVPVLVEEVHDYGQYDLSYAKFRGWA
ncbi:signal peptide protein [Cohnella hashimotonis]|uniref:Signal peptide protein n=1 Tax=Cohnella hashimotonis TaxID=2826895 RepID=A0ABT6TGV0_9BACL|nr:signal peptide protein [Cohnella hashimotonis]MDI4645974.1 signal peptide protein [Cohnella hashimotonis]